MRRSVFTMAMATATVIESEIEAEDGVIHVIDAVMIPDTVDLHSVDER